MNTLAYDFINVWRATRNLSTLTNNKTNIFYDSLKNINTDYVEAKSSLMLAFRQANFGNWIKKPDELKTFELNIYNEI